jgi:Asp/Glu/hydantoin racemase
MSGGEFLVLNPNTSGWMTARVVERLQTLLGADAVLHGWTAAAGPAVIDDDYSFAQGAAALQPLARAALDRHRQASALLLACFGDPGLETLREAAAGVPVVGLAECAMRQTAAEQGAFAVLTCGPDWVPLLTQRAAQFGLADALAGVWALPVNGAEFAREPLRWRAALTDAAEQARQRGARAVILGGAAFAGFEDLIDTALPRIDALQCAARALRLKLPHNAATRPAP